MFLAPAPPPPPPPIDHDGSVAAIAPLDREHCFVLGNVESHDDIGSGVWTQVYHCPPPPPPPPNTTTTKVANLKSCKLR